MGFLLEEVEVVVVAEHSEHSEVEKGLQVVQVVLDRQREPESFETCEISEAHRNTNDTI